MELGKNCTILTKLSLSDDALWVKIAEDTFHNQGKMPSNFGMNIPDYKRAFNGLVKPFDSKGRKAAKDRIVRLEDKARRLSHSE